MSSMDISPMRVPAIGRITANRRSIFYAYWALLGFVGVGLALALKHDSSMVVGLLLASYALQGLFSELKGVRLYPGYVELPYRPWISLPLLVFWRKRVWVSEIHLLLPFSKCSRPEAVEVRMFDGGRLAIQFCNRDMKLKFCQILKGLNPCIEIYRNGPRSHSRPSPIVIL